MKLPLLPLRDLIVFPGSTQVVSVGRDKSVAAIENAYKANGEILMVCQKDSSVLDPSPADLYQIGVLGSVKAIEKAIGGIKVTINANRIVKLHKMDTKNPTMLQAFYTEYKPQVDNSLEGKALLKNLKNDFEKYAKKSEHPVNVEVLMKLTMCSDLNEAINLILESTNIKIEEKQSILEIEDLKDRGLALLSSVKKQLEVIEVQNKIDNDLQKKINKQQKEYYLREQRELIDKELGEEDGEKDELEELKTKIATTMLTDDARKKCEKEYKRLKQLSPMSADAGVIRNYLDHVLGLPWGKQTEDNYDIKRAQATLDADHYGLTKVKERVLEQLSVLSLTKGKKGAAICLSGSPGLGKTSLARSIAKSLNREFVRISLGGVRDESEIRGHRRTYVGSMPGKIISAFKKSASSNPVILLDEIDKMSSDFKGDPSAAMLEVLDPAQNNAFNDHYLDMDFDLSKVIFITTANYVENIPKPLLDRMELIKLDSYIEDEKFNIAKSHIIKKAQEDSGLKDKSIAFTDDAILEIIRGYTMESGVRGLERKISTIFRKLAMQTMTKEFKSVIITAKKVDEFLGVENKIEWGTIEKKPEIGLVNGMAYNSAGGDLLKVECTKTFGKGGLVVTGQLGDVMKESSNIAFTYVKSIIPEKLLEGSDVHIHFPDGATPKDGPSAGIALVTTIVSCLTTTPVKNALSMTGEVTIRGKVLPIGGVKEKVISAYRGGVREVILPLSNKKDVKDIPKKIADDIKFHYCEDVKEVLKIALVKYPKELK